MNFNLSKHIHIIMISLYAYFLICHVKENDYVTMVILTMMTCLAICYVKKNQEGLTNKGVVDKKPSVKPSVKPVKKAPGSDIVRPLPAVMGPYDGLCMQTGNREHWMKSPDNTALIPNDSLFAYLSSQGPQKPVFTDNSALTGPPIDGQKGSAKKMFMFANNRSSPNCCPSTYTTSTGCICTTGKQRDYVASRGHQGSIDLKDI